MTEDDYLDEIAALWPKLNEPQVFAELVRLVDEAIQQCGPSAGLLCVKGDLVRLAPADMRFLPSDEPADYYRKALEIDPRCWEAWEELGYCYDIDCAFDMAIDAFRHSIALGGGANSFYGLARCLAQRGDKSEALQTVSQALASCGSAEDAQELRQLKDEIERGIWDPT